MTTQALIVLLFAILLVVIISGLMLLSRSITIALSQRVDVESKIADSIKTVENVLTGSFTKGSAGENIIELALATLPPEWVVRDLVVGNKRIEFGIRLPDNVVLPIDSKLATTDLLAQLDTCENVDEKRQLKRTIQVHTRNRALEVTKYLHPSVTTSFGLAVVPDPLFAVCAEIVPSLSQQNVMLVNYSLLIPYILLVFHMTLKNAPIDPHRLDAFIKSADQSVVALRKLIQSQFSRATVMLENFKSDVEAQLNTLSTTLATLRALGANSAENDSRQNNDAASGAAV